MSTEYATFDVETANGMRGSICAIGVTIVRDNAITESMSWLVQPPPGLDTFAAFNTSIHGINASHVAEAPSFAESIDHLVQVVGDRPIVAHNAAFDVGAVREGCNHLNLDWPRWTYACSLVLSRRLISLLSYRLPLVCDSLDVPLGRHHDAQSDAEACANIILALARQHNVHGLDELMTLAQVNYGHVQPGSWQGCLAHPTGSHGLATPDLNPDADPRHPLYGQSVCFTGALSFRRQDMWNAIAEYGAAPSSNVTKNTNILVIGDGFVGDRPEEFGTRKARRAAELLAQGQSIEVLNEEDFLTLLESVGGSQ